MADYVKYLSNMFTYNRIKTVVVASAIIIAAVFPITDYPDRKSAVLPFSNHAYENPNHHSISGPFLSKIRFRPNPAAIDFKNGYNANDKQSACNYNLTNIANPDERKKIAMREEKCKIMRVPELHLGHIHSSWSVLGAQSSYNLIKHICCILIVFLLFASFEEMIYAYPKNIDGKEVVKEGHENIRHHHHFVRSVLLILAIVIFGFDVAFDIDNDNISEVEDNKSKYAIGSIATGFSFCVVTLMIMCFTYMQEPYEVERNEPKGKPDGLTQGGANNPPPMEQTREEGGLGNDKDLYIGGLWKYPSDYNIRREPDAKYMPTHTNRSEAYTRLCDIYYNIHMSYLMLLIFPLVVILALHSTNTVLVDVHIQLIFFSSIFVALLDICQALVMGVLSTFNTTVEISDPIELVKVFVVLAFVLCKLFVCIPSFQLMFLYYVGGYSFSLILMQVLAVGAASVVDLVYTFGLSEIYYLKIKKVIFTIYIFVSLGFLIAIK
jgi:hypothetical protein